MKRFKWDVIRNGCREIEVVAVNRDAAIQAAKGWYRDVSDWCADDKQEHEAMVARYASEIKVERCGRA